MDGGGRKEQAEIGKLKAELSILKSAYASMEKENSQLRAENARAAQSRIDAEESLKRKLELLQEENRIVENQKRYLGGGSQSGGVSERISPRFALSKALAGEDFGCEESMKKMRFFRDYFFDDFYTLESSQLFSIIEDAAKFSNRRFLELFVLFSCKKDVFVRFSSQAFENSLFLPAKIEVLDSIPPEWAVDMLDTHLKQFVAENKSALGTFICHIAARCPLSLHKVLSKSDFKDALRIPTPVNYQIVYEICRNRIHGYVDETSIHLVPGECLRLTFGNDYFEFL